MKASGIDLIAAAFAWFSLCFSFVFFWNFVDVEHEKIKIKMNIENEIFFILNQDKKKVSNGNNSDSPTFIFYD